MKTLKRFAKDESGATAIEYAIRRAPALAGAFSFLQSARLYLPFSEI